MKLVKKFVAVIAVCGSLLTSSVAFAAENAVQSAAEAKTEQVQTQNKVAVITEKLNINTATAEEIQKALTGIGAKKAEAIVQYREKHGAFTAADQLLEVQGIGKATLEKNQDRISF